MDFSGEDEGHVNAPVNPDLPEFLVIPLCLWVGKTVSLHNSSGVCIAEETSYSLKWENGLIMTVQASQLKSHGIDSVCTYKKSKHCKEGKKSHFSRAHNLQTSL